MKNRLFLIIFMSFCVLFHTFTQNLNIVKEDINTLLDEFGRELLPHMLQDELSGNGIWSADFNNKRRVFLSVSGGAIFTDGMLKFIDEENTHFQDLDVYSFVDNAIDSSPGIIKKNYDRFKEFLPHLNFRIALGFNFFADTEMIFLFSFLPKSVIERIADKYGIPGFEWGSLNLGFRFRKVLLRDRKYLPDVSISIGYTFSKFHVAYDMPEFSQDWSGATLSIDGNLFMDNMINTVGIDFVISKKIKFFVPFFGISAWYQWAKYTAGMDDFLSIIEDSGHNEVDRSTEGPEAEVKIRELSFLLSAGFELVLWRFVFTPYATYSFQTKTFSANMEIRLELGKTESSKD
jgi:hypothetical protein